MSKYDFQCTLCGEQFDGEYGSKPDICPECGCTDFEDAEAAEEREARNRAVNAEEDYREELRNE